MTVVVVGGGAMGGLWAARLAACGVDTVVLDVSAALVDAVTSQGLRVDANGESIVAHPRAATGPAGLFPADVVFFFVKAHQTAAAAAGAAELVGPRTTVVSLQNGWGNADVLARTVDPAKLVVGVTYHSGTTASPGWVLHTGRGPTFLGPYLDSGDVGRSEEVADLLNQAGLETTATTSVKMEIWRKLILNAATLPTSALTRLRAGDLAEASSSLELIDALAAEAVAVARGLGFDIDLAERTERIRTVLKGAGDGKPSMLQDVEARRKTEWEVITGAVIRAATDLGTDVPLHRAMAALLAGLERSWRYDLP